MTPEPYGRFIGPLAYGYDPQNHDSDEDGDEEPDEELYDWEDELPL